MKDNRPLTQADLEKMDFELLAGMGGGQGDSLDALAGAADRTGEAVKGEGVNRRIKMDINNWVRQVDDVLSNSRSKIVRENRYGISIGMDLLLAYLKEIAGRAIELEDEKLIDILLDLHVLKKEED